MKKTTTTQNRITTFTTNWLANKNFYPIAMGLILLGLFSCDENEEIGLNVQGNQVLNTLYTDTLTLNTSVVLLDSINTTNASIILVGKTEDSRFGTTAAAGYSQLSMGITTNLDFGEGATYDSITMRLAFPYIFGDTVTQQTYVVNEITEVIDTIDYFSSDRIPETSIGEEIGSVKFAPADDSLNFVTFRLSDDFGQKIFDRGGEVELTDQASFSAFFNGIRIATTNDANNTILGFNPLGSSSFVTLHYQGPSGDSLAPRTFNFTFGRGYNGITPDLTSSTTISNLTQGTSINTDFTNQECVLQAGTGIATLIRFPHLNNLGGGKRILINRAELFFRPVEDLNADETKLPPASIFLREVNDDGSGGEFIPRELSNEAIVSQYNSSGRSYPALRITSYIQDLVDGNRPNNGVLLALSPQLERESVNHVVIADANHPTTSQMQLQIYYTILE